MNHIIESQYRTKNFSMYQKCLFWRVFVLIEQYFTDEVYEQIAFFINLPLNSRSSNWLNISMCFNVFCAHIKNTFLTSFKLDGVHSFCQLPVQHLKINFQILLSTKLNFGDEMFIWYVLMFPAETVRPIIVVNKIHQTQLWWYTDYSTFQSTSGLCFDVLRS